MKKEQPVPPALAAEALLNKSRVFAKRSLVAKQAVENVESQLWAALALEVLGKAALASVHPSLIVAAENTNSLLEANGIKTGTAVKTIQGHEVYARLKHTVPHFGTPVFEDCKKLAERRNSELHSGESALATVPPEIWEGPFWNAADLILDSMNLSLDDWLGVDSKSPRKTLSAMRQAKKEAARQRIKQAAESFRKPGGKQRSKAEIESLRQKSRAFRAYEISDKLRYMLDDYWLWECPACESTGVVGGDLTSEQPADDQSYAEPGFEIVEREYEPAEFHCPTCKLHLVGDEALAVANMTDAHIEAEEREIEYEPDYGND